MIFRKNVIPSDPARHFVQHRYEAELAKRDIRRSSFRPEGDGEGEGEGGDRGEGARDAMGVGWEDHEGDESEVNMAVGVGSPLDPLAEGADGAYFLHPSIC